MPCMRNVVITADSLMVHFIGCLNFTEPRVNVGAVKPKMDDIVVNFVGWPFGER